MLDKLKKIEELVNGQCVVVARTSGYTKEFEGYYNSARQVVYMTVPSHYEVIGYKQ